MSQLSQSSQAIHETLVSAAWKDSSATHLGAVTQYGQQNQIPILT